MLQEINFSFIRVLVLIKSVELLTAEVYGALTILLMYNQKQLSCDYLQATPVKKLIYLYILHFIFYSLFYN